MVWETDKSGAQSNMGYPTLRRLARSKSFLRSNVGDVLLESHTFGRRRYLRR